MILPNWLVKFLNWIKEHPIKSMFIVTIPICIVTSLITTLLLQC